MNVKLSITIVVVAVMIVVALALILLNQGFAAKTTTTTCTKSNGVTQGTYPGNSGSIGNSNYCQTSITKAGQG